MRKIHLALVAVTSVINLFLNDPMSEKEILIFQKHLVISPLCIYYKKILLLLGILKQVNRTCLVLSMILFLLEKSIKIINVRLIDTTPIPYKNDLKLIFTPSPKDS